MRYREAVELRADDGLRLSGVAVRYGEETGPPRNDFRERIEAGAFGDVAKADATLNLQHNPAHTLASTHGGGLEISQVGDEVRFVAELPDNQESRNAVNLVRRRVLRAASIEYWPLRERQSGGVTVVEKGMLTGIGIVRAGAYLSATVQARAAIRLRQDGQGLEGAFYYDTDHVVADRAARIPELLEVRQASTRKERVRPGAFRFALDDPSREVSVLMGRDYGKPLASKLAGSVEFDDGPDALRFSIPTLPAVGYVEEFRRLLTSGAAVFGVAPLFRLPPIPDAMELQAEEGNADVLIRIIREAVLTAIAIVTRPPRGNPGEVVLREAQSARRVRVWL